MGDTIQVKAEVLIPRVPNFVRYVGGSIAVEDLDDDELRKIGMMWTQALLENARKKRGTGS